MNSYKQLLAYRYEPGQSFLHRLDPRSKLSFAVLNTMAIALSPGFKSLGLLTATAVLAISVSTIPLRSFWQDVKGLWPLITLLLVYSIWKEQDGMVWWSWWELRLTSEGFAVFGLYALKLILIITVLQLMKMTTPLQALLTGLHRLLRPLERLHVPVSRGLFTLELAILYIPQFIDELERMLKSLKARGADYESWNVGRRWRSMLAFLSNMTIAVFQRADALATAIEARGYTPTRPRTSRVTLYWSWRDTLLLCIAAAQYIVMIRLEE
ncbi:energy-coupling factor transporter transmembrane protein EcfT [Paenibacillus sp. YYML68]|uniref:energy-coupling factor transporter transmembrane component T family protein n=1 Tax=Paenibacillus sp. YYML68 TaxID=2909250 RepID=UPI0024925855|nr:energy-coupling factor transporter transmembrane component T [Paenibacillus sp. YYML68]